MAYEYKVLTQKDRVFSGRFDPEVLENLLNKLAREGWRVVGVTTGQVTSALASRDEMIIILERNTDYRY